MQSECNGKPPTLTQGMSFKFSVAFKQLLTSFLKLSSIGRFSRVSSLNHISSNSGKNISTCLNKIIHFISWSTILILFYRYYLISSFKKCQLQCFSKVDQSIAHRGMTYLKMNELKFYIIFIDKLQHYFHHDEKMD